MNEFKELKSIFENKNSFDVIIKDLMKKDNMILGKQMIEKLECSTYLNARDLLSIFLIYKVPKDTLGDLDIESNKHVYESAKFLVENEIENNEVLKIKLIKFVCFFKEWKKEDISILKNQLFNEFHQLNVDMANCEDDDHEKLIIFQETQKKILECAKQIGGEEFVNEIQSYAPVLINVNDLKEQYDKAYYDVFIEEFENKKFEKTTGLLEFIKNILKTIKPSEGLNLDKQLDIPFIIHKLNYDQFSNTKCLDLFNYLLDVIKKVQSPAHDERLEKIRTNLKIKEIYFPDILLKCMDLIKNIIHDLENIQNKMNKKK